MFLLIINLENFIRLWTSHILTHNINKKNSCYVENANPHQSLYGKCEYIDCCRTRIQLIIILSFIFIRIQ